MFDAHCANCLHLKGSSRFAETRRTEKRLCKKLKNYAPELIGMDLSMPVMNGLDAARLIHHLLPRVPIIMFSECAGAFTQQQASAVGIAALVSKEHVTSLVGTAVTWLKTLLRKSICLPNPGIQGCLSSRNARLRVHQKWPVALLDGLSCGLWPGDACK